MNNRFWKICSVCVLAAVVLSSSLEAGRFMREAPAETVSHTVWPVLPYGEDVGNATIRLIIDRPAGEFCGGKGRFYNIVARHEDKGEPLGEIALEHISGGEIAIEEFKIIKMKSIWNR